MSEVRVGTSGWSYREWVGPFYPPGTSAARMLATYAGQLPTVEAHATFRRLPSVGTLVKWVAEVPPHFRFAPKAHVGITHRRDTEGLVERTRRFCDALAPLGDRLGPVLFQLPHHEPDLARLDLILGALPPGLAAAFDVGPAWVTPEVLGRLDGAGATLVLAETDERELPAVEVGPVAYVRLRRSAYTDGELADRSGRLARLAAGGRDVYAYVKHDDSGRGPIYARRLMEAVTA